MELVSIMILIALAGIYMLPTAIAVATGHPYDNGIAILNVLLGWTLLGWVGALIWAVSKPRATTPVRM